MIFSKLGKCEAIFFLVSFL